jgi:hypothetical protein
MKIRPIINSINGPCSKLSFLIYSILKPVEKYLKYSISSSDTLIDTIESADDNVFTEYIYPASLDIVDMYTNIPGIQAAHLAIDMAIKYDIDLYGLLAEDIVNILNVIFDNNFFTFKSILYKQITGLPMGSCISGLLANIFLNNLEMSIVPELPLVFYNRYVDDIFFVTKDEYTAQLISDTFNSKSCLKFELEKSVDGKINILDFGLEISNGKANICFYQKKARSNIFSNFHSNQPFNLKRQIVLNEWRRITKRCCSKLVMIKEKKRFIKKLVCNDYPVNLIKKWLHSAKRRYAAADSTDNVFYLSIPFVNDGINKLIKKAIAPLGINVRLSHKSRRLQSWLKHDFTATSKCSLANCKLNDINCNKSKVVYQCVCECGASYIGSTMRPLHIRIKEHHNLSSSAIFQHKLNCNGKWHTKIKAYASDCTDLRFKEAILIKQIHPSLNRKEEILPFQLVV